jgi:hypothetical protein
MRIADGIRAALGDPREERLGRERPIGVRIRTEAESRYAAHEPLFDSKSDATHTVDDRCDVVFVNAALHAPSASPSGDGSLAGAVIPQAGQLCSR